MPSSPGSRQNGNTKGSVAKGTTSFLKRETDCLEGWEPRNQSIADESEADQCRRDQYLATPLAPGHHRDPYHLDLPRSHGRIDQFPKIDFPRADVAGTNAIYLAAHTVLHSDVDTIPLLGDVALVAALEAPLAGTNCQTIRPARHAICLPEAIILRKDFLVGVGCRVLALPRAVTVMLAKGA
jgi:hypothetical protein